MIMNLVQDVVVDLLLAAARVVLPTQLDGVPNPSPNHPLLGHLTLIEENFHRWYHFSQDVTTELKKDPNYNGCWYTTMPMMKPELVLTDPELIQWLLDNGESHPALQQFCDSDKEVLSGAFGWTSIFLIDGPEWSFRRKYYSHLFSLRSLREVMLPEFRQNSAKIIDRVQQRVESGEAIDLQDLYARATLDAICMIAFSEDLGALDTDEPPEFMKAFDLSQDITTLRMVDPLWKIKRAFNLSYEKDFRSSMKIVNSRIYQVLDERKKSRDAPPGSPLKKKRYPMLDLFEEKATKDGHELDDHTLRDIVWDFLIAGRDTTACAASWLTYYLIRNPRVLERVRGEMAGKDCDNFNVLLHELPYLTACCLETERLQPSVSVDSKGTSTTMTLPNGVVVPPNTSVSFSPYISGRNPDVWGPDVFDFSPERWLNEGGTDVKQVSEGRFPSFNGGPRLCLGQTMALLELKCFATHLFDKFDFTLDARHQKDIDELGDIAYKVTIILWIKDGLWVRATKRKCEST